jgi:hypothetical protein
MDPIHSTFHFFVNKFHGHSLCNEFTIEKRTLHDRWMIEWTRTSAIDHVRYMVCTHVPIPCFNLHFSTPTGQFHYKEMWSQFAQHFIHFVLNFMEIHYNEFTIGNGNKKWMVEWTRINVIDQVGYVVCTHISISSFDFHGLAEASFTTSPIHSTFHSFCNKFHGHEFTIEKRTQHRTIERSMTHAIDRVRYMVCTCVPILSFNLYHSMWGG